MAETTIPDWVRGSGAERHERARQMVEEVREGREALFQTMYTGSAALRILRGIAQRGDAETVLSALIVDLETEVQNCAAALFAETDLNSTDARQAHFQGRVAASILHRFNAAVSAGAQAATIYREDQP